MIGTEVPASPEGRQRQQGRGRRQKDRSPPTGNEKSFTVLFGVSREEAPEEVIASRATRLLRFFGTSVSKAGRKSGYPKKGRGNRAVLAPKRLPVSGSGKLGKPDLASRKTSEPSGDAVE